MLDVSPTKLNTFDSPSVVFTDEADDFFWNGLTLELAPFGLENIHDYVPGGHHPVHLGDAIKGDNRYRVIHKLGNGGFANVWLARDLESQVPRYVVLKILMADVSTDDCREFHASKLKNFSKEVGGSHISLPLDQFRFEGPNGSHLCFVYPVAGPRSSWIIEKSENPSKSLRKVAFQVAEAMDLLHRHGLCHGDLTPSNVLLKLSGLDGLEESRVIRALGEPIQNKVMAESEDYPIGPSAPEYLVLPVNFSEIDPCFVTDDVCVIDFGESFETSTPPEFLGTPQVFCSPELVLDRVAGIGSDIWALACTLYDIRTGEHLFSIFDHDLDSHLYCMVLILGKLPEPWWTTWEGRKDCFEEEPDAEGHVVLKTPDGGQPRSIQESLANGVYLDRIDMGIAEPIHHDIPAEEIELFADLLDKMLQYKPDDRITAADVLDHGWFKL